MFKKILIANRGEIAVRVIRACKEWGIATVAVHSDVDRDSMHVRLADESVCIGSHQPVNSYLNVPALMSAIELTKAEAVHPGYGFLSENANFAKVLEENNIKFIGASSKLIEMMGDKIQAKKIAKEYGLPVIEGSEGGITDIKAAKELCKKIGFPVLIKASAGGGGKGMKIVKKEEEFETLFSTAKSEIQVKPKTVSGIEVKSPIIGTAYHSPEPGAKKFAEIGKKIKKGETIMIVEAMKTMNHVPSTADGIVKEICVEDGQAVEFGQTIIILE